MKKKYAFLLIAVVFLLGLASVLSLYVTQGPPIKTAQQAASVRTIQLDNQTVRVSVADTQELRQVGLSGRSGLSPDEGMLFVFPQDGKYAFWMKDMRFLIDILWLSADGRIVYMVQNISPDTYPHSFVPTAPARYVLELPAGFAQTYNLKVGDEVQL